MAWQNAFAPSFEFRCWLASVFLLPRGQLSVWFVGWKVVLSEGGQLKVLVGHTFVDYKVNAT